MSIETIASMCHRVSIVPYTVGAKEVFIFFNYEVPLRIFFQNLFSTLYNIYFSHEDQSCRFREN